MNRIQRLFELLAGIPQEERHHLALTQKVYSASRVDIHSLRTPACWRRKAIVRGVKP